MSLCFKHCGPYMLNYSQLQIHIVVHTQKITNKQSKKVQKQDINKSYTCVGVGRVYITVWIFFINSFGAIDQPSYEKRK